MDGNGKKFNCYDRSITTPRAPSIVELNDSPGKKITRLYAKIVIYLEKMEHDPSERAPSAIDDEIDCRISPISSDACDETERSSLDYLFRFRELDVKEKIYSRCRSADRNSIAYG